MLQFHRSAAIRGGAKRGWKKLNDKTDKRPTTPQSPIRNNFKNQPNCKKTSYLASHKPMSATEPNAEEHTGDQRDTNGCQQRKLQPGTNLLLELFPLLKRRTRSGNVLRKAVCPFWSTPSLSNAKATVNLVKL